MSTSGSSGSSLDPVVPLGTMQHEWRIIDIKGELKMKDFGTVGVFLKWLGEIARE
jgi:hypothetical protein